jgi:acyl-CoA synthetase (AMP-forming)/AMP-acid ligase II
MGDLTSFMYKLVQQPPRPSPLRASPPSRAFTRYLTLTGRIKELINRGGEKISPLEVDAVLLGHPGIAEAVSFAAPDPKYGEEVRAKRECLDKGTRGLYLFSGHETGHQA